MFWDEQKLLANIRNADTEDLLDRVTAFRAGMEPEAVVMIEIELRERGVSTANIAERMEEYRRECIWLADGSAGRCSQCDRPAVVEGIRWHRLLRIIPLFPRRFRYCKSHAPARNPGQA